MLEDLKLPILQQRRQETRLVMLYKVVRGMVPAINADEFLIPMRNKGHIKQRVQSDFHTRVKPGFIGRQGSSDRSFYDSFTALPTDTCSERNYPFVYATNRLSDTALKICIARVITLCSQKPAPKKHALF